MKFEDIKGAIRTRKSMKDRQSYCQKKKDKVINLGWWPDMLLFRTGGPVQDLSPGL
jgi:hypothetical protein